jgi:hypothetical protein
VDDTVLQKVLVVVEVEGGRRMVLLRGGIHEEEGRLVIHSIHEGGGRVGMLQMVVEDVHDAVEVDQQQKREAVDSVENDVVADSLDDDDILGTDNDVGGVHYDRHTSSPRVVILYPQHSWVLSPWDHVYQVSVVDY